mmetsp:Transcript_38601/g.111363  ORF Transcript_38601/g.111363 Transcript_38601/m.111363 type:complete len:201 (+) Transcript_38601:328-930(+)
MHAAQRLPPQVGPAVSGHCCGADGLQLAADASQLATEVGLLEGPRAGGGLVALVASDGTALATRDLALRRPVPFLPLHGRDAILAPNLRRRRCLREGLFRYKGGGVAIVVAMVAGPRLVVVEFATVAALRVALDFRRGAQVVAPCVAEGEGLGERHCREAFPLGRRKLHQHALFGATHHRLQGGDVDAHLLGLPAIPLRA